LDQVSKAIKTFRESKGWSKAELGRRLGNISGQLIGQYEREDDPKTPGGDFFINWKKAFGFDLLNTETIVSRETEETLQDQAAEVQSRRTLEKTLENMSADKLHSTEIIKMLAEDKLRNTAIFEKLAALLEKQFSSSSPDPVHQSPSVTDKIKDLPSGPGRLGLGKKKGQVSK
jgi:transcriptional regulator with XRE-family HTH domain